MTASSPRNGRGLKPLLLAVALSAGLHTGATLAQTAGPAPQTIDIPAGNLSQALDRLGEQTGVLITYAPGLVQGLNAPRVSGQLSASEALRRLLSGSGIQVEAVNGKTFVLRRTPAADPAPPAGQAPQSTSRRKAQADPVTQDLEKVTVTGTRIRGGTTPSPVITIGSERIREEGFTDLGEVIRSLPQNFSGGQNPGVVNGADSSIANQNLTGGSSLNFRGLGPDATLTLLNGRRLSYGGPFQSVDISAIPVEAVDRIEIVADGASAIYGSDAVAGVGNVILKREFDGVTVGARYGDASDGGLATREYTITAGTTWATGGLIATYKDASNDPIYAHQRDYTDHLIEPKTIYSGTDLRSGLLSAHQAIGDIVELRLDALRTERDIVSFAANATAYTYLPYKTTTTLISPSVEFSLPGEWTLSAGGTWGDDKNKIKYFNTVRSTEATTPTVDNCQCNESRSYEVNAEGPLFAVAGGDARLAIGAGYRKNSFFDRNYLAGPSVVGSSGKGEESSRFAYAEMNFPFIGPEQSIAGVRRLAMTAAVRGEDYDGFGGVTTPKLGLIYGPSDDFTLKASWGRSFKAPTLVQRFQPATAYVQPIAWYNGTGYPADATIMLLWGGNTDLKPERARTWTASLAFHPEAFPGLEAELTWFNIDYTGRVVQPLASYWLVLNDPAYAEFIQYSPTAAQLDEITSVLPIVDSTGNGYDPNNVYAVLFNRYTNAMRQEAKGVDLTGSYRFDLGEGRLTIRGSGSWLNISQQTTPGQSSIELTGALFNPASVNGRLGAVWDQGGFTASAFANYTSGVTASSAVAATEKKTSSFTTFDATLRYGLGDRDGILSRLELVLSAQNIFNRQPPVYSPISTTAVPYDSLNYSAIGRYLSLSVSKSW